MMFKEDGRSTCFVKKRRGDLHMGGGGVRKGRRTYSRVRTASTGLGKKGRGFPGDGWGVRLTGGGGRLLCAKIRGNRTPALGRLSARSMEAATWTKVAACLAREDLSGKKGKK